MNIHAQVDYLKEEVRQLRESMIGKRAGFPFEWGLTIAEEKILNSLYTSPTRKRTTGTLIRISTIKDQVDPKIVQVHICKLRKKLNPLGIAITTNWGEGYELPERSVAIIRKALT